MLCCIPASRTTTPAIVTHQPRAHHIVIEIAFDGPMIALRLASQLAAQTQPLIVSRNL